MDSERRYKFLKVYLGNYIDEGRDTREMLTAMEAGYEVEILSHGAKKHFPAGEKSDLIQFRNENGILVSKFFPKYVVHFPKKLFKIQYWIKWARKVREMKADVISGHDINALLIAYLSTLFTPSARKPKLIYDSHEFEIGRNAIRNKWQIFYITHLEHFLIKRCEYSIMVNESIADEVQKIHRISKKPLVVRSIPPYWNLDLNVIHKRRKEILELAKKSENTFIMIYHGAILRSRGIEKVIDILTEMEGIIFIVMGYELEKGYIEGLKNRAQGKNSGNKILFIPPVKPDRIWEYTGAADVGIILLESNYKSYYFALPNKFFETVQSMTPLITSDFPEMKKLIEKYDIGITCDPTKSNEIIAAIKKMKEDKEYYQKLKGNLICAKNDLCWENEKKGLLEALEQLLKKI